MLTKKNNLKIILTSLFFTFSFLNIQNVDAYQSFHQGEQLNGYCSKEACADPATEPHGVGYNMCDNKGEHECLLYKKSFRSLYNINDPGIYCYGQTSCDLPDDSEFVKSVRVERSTTILNMARIYMPPGTRRSAVMLAGLEQSDEVAAVAKFGSPPDCAIPQNYEDIVEDYPGGASGGTSVLRMKDTCVFSANYSGEIFPTTVNYHEMLTEGGWLYINVLYGFFPRAYSYVLAVNVGTYRKWYNCMNEKDGWDEYGDPKMDFTACDNLSTTPTPTPSP
ncbi:MAG: hypothetical protein WCK16_01675, partial [Candidatus Moraniibacteriota bacterium]